MENLMTTVCEPKGSKKQRRSERKAPFLSGEEMVLISIGSHRPMIAKLLDLSEDGTLVYLSEESDVLDAMGTDCRLTLYHDGKVFELASKIARRSRRLIGFEFVNPQSTVLKHIRAKIIQMADWVKG
jgi:PilZ domain-containing protein